MSLRERLKAGKPLIIAHRGAAADAPENTMAAFRLALEQRADSIELDVHLSKDGVPVVIHDHTLERTTNGKGLVGEHTLAQLKELDAGGWFGPSFEGESIPTLANVLQWAKGRIAAHVELKNNPIKYPGIAQKVVDVVRRLKMEEEVEIFSFDHTCAKEAKGLCPDLVTGVCYVADPVDRLALARMAGAIVLHPHWSSVRPEVVAEAHRQGLFVVTWTVNDPRVARQMARWAVDGLTTDAPGRVRRALKSQALSAHKL